MSLEPFGFTRTQDLVFWALARRGSATGYAIARDIGIARANVYHALEVLARRGLAFSSAGRPARYQANSAYATAGRLAATDAGYCHRLVVPSLRGSGGRHRAVAQDERRAYLQANFVHR